uniref:Uncharacterized protein n=1 Tax=Oryza sativa subsp. japonica TaxID=39947 RepID=Q6YY89_ORYSJ|nr:hypothetical protein [Oryza sativa Japonica Group]
MARGLAQGIPFWPDPSTARFDWVVPVPAWPDYRAMPELHPRHVVLSHVCIPWAGTVGPAPCRAV